MQLPRAYYTARSRSVILIIGAAAFVAGGVFLFTHAHEMDDPGFVQFIAGICVLFFGACLLAGIYTIYKPRLMLTLTPRGIELPKATIVRWDEIAGFDVARMHSNKFVAVILKDHEEWMARHPQGKWATNLGLMGTPVVFSMSVSAVSTKEMIATLEELHARHGVNHV